MFFLWQKSSKCACHEVKSHMESPFASNNLQASASRSVLANGKASATPTTSPISRSNEVK
ncbi:hypothetical protein MKW98_009758, partial [Papaver atlanticum]